MRRSWWSSIAAAAGIVWLCSCERGVVREVISGSRPESVGQVLVDEAGRLLGPRGGKVLLVMDNPGQDKLDACYGYRRGFEKGLKRHPELALAGVAMLPYPAGPERYSDGLRLIFYERLRKEFRMAVQKAFAGARE